MNRLPLIPSLIIRKRDAIREYAIIPYMVKDAGIIPFCAKKLGARTVYSPAGTESWPIIRAIAAIIPVNRILKIIFSFYSF